MDDNSKVIELERVAAAKPAQLVDRGDDELMLLARGGYDGAFDALIRRHQEMILCFAMKYLGDAISARDVAHNTFLELYGAIARYQPRGRFRAFLFTLALNQCRMWVRKRKYDRQARERLSSFEPELPAQPDEQILGRERQRDVERALCNLSPKLREVVTLRFNGELSYDEIGKILGIPLGTVKSRLFAALERMRNDLTGGLR